MGEDAKKFDQNPVLADKLSAFIERHKAGSPTDASVYWISLKPWQIAAQFYQENGIPVSTGVVKRQLKAMNFRYRKISKQMATGTYALRDEQFRIIFHLILLVNLKTPVISLDCKKKEQLGNLYRGGKCYVQGLAKSYDHDYAYLGTGKVIPLGIYDLQRNEGYISIGKSAETAQFIHNHLLWWWDNYGIDQYPDAQSMLILCDAGGANSYRHHAFKKQMLALAHKIGIQIIIAHYPPYASKWNPIEHRLFPHLHRSMEGVIITNYEMVKEMMQKTSTKNGLKVFVRIDETQYLTGIKTSREELDFTKIHFHKINPKLNYTLSP